MTYDPRNAFQSYEQYGRAKGPKSTFKTSVRPKARPGSLGAKKDDKPKVTFKSAFEAAGGNTKKKEKQNVFPMKVYESPRFKIPEPAYVSTSTLDDAPSSPDPILDMPNVRSFMAPRQSEPFKGYVAGEEPIRGRSPGRGLMSPPQPEAPNVPQYQDAIMRQLTRAQMETVPRPKIRPQDFVTEAIDKILDNEGGYQNNPSDKGNYRKADGTVLGTMRGITPETYARYTGRPIESLTEEDMKSITEETARNIVRQNHWERPKLDQLPKDIQSNVFDMHVNSGLNAIKILQRLIGMPEEEVDGYLGPKTLKYMANSNVTNNDYVDARIDYYKSITKDNPDNKKYLRGWINRANKYRD